MLTNKSLSIFLICILASSFTGTISYVHGASNVNINEPNDNLNVNPSDEVTSSITTRTITAKSQISLDKDMTTNVNDQQVDSSTSLTTSSMLSNGASDTNLVDDTAEFITKEGTFFPKASRGRLSFVVHNTDGNHYTIKGSLERVNDVTGRYFYIYHNGQQISSQIVRSGISTFSATVGPVSDGDEFDLEIYWGNYVERGWFLHEVYLDDGDTEKKLLFDEQYFPELYRSKIETKFVGGPDTDLRFTVENVGDTSCRFISASVDGVTYLQETIICNEESFFVNLGYYSERTVHTLTLQIRSGSAAGDKVWKLTDLDISYEILRVEIDWMSGWKPSYSVRDSIFNYFTDHGYERVVLDFSEEVPTKSDFTGSDLEDYYNSYSDYKSSYTDNHRYLVFGKNQDDGNLGFTLTSTYFIDYDGDGELDQGEGTSVEFKPYAFIAAKTIYWTINGRTFDNKLRAVTMHELGHTLGLLKIRWNSGDSAYEEYYDWGNRDISVMNRLSSSNSYSTSHYSLWYWEGDGVWWDLRQGFNSQDSTHSKVFSDVEV